MMKEFFSNPRYGSTGPPNLYDAGPWYERREHFYAHPYYKHNLESDFQPYSKFGLPCRETAHQYDPSECSGPKRR